MISRRIVSNCIVSFPAAKQRKTRSDFELGKFVLLAGRAQVRGRDVADLVAVVNVSGGGRQQCLQSLHRRGTALFAHVVESRERALELGARVIQIDCLLDGDVAPVRDLDVAQQVADDQERRVVLVVNGELALLKRLHVLVGSVGDGRVALAGGLELRVALGLVTGQVDNGRLRLGRVERVVVVIAAEDHRLLVVLRDLHRVGLDQVGKD